MVIANYAYTTRDTGTFQLIKDGKATLCYGGIIFVYWDVELRVFKNGAVGAELEERRTFTPGRIAEMKAHGAKVLPIENWDHIRVQVEQFSKRTV